MGKGKKDSVKRPRLSFDALVATKGTVVAKARLDKRLEILGRKETRLTDKLALIKSKRDSLVLSFQAAVSAALSAVNTPTPAPAPAPVTPDPVPPTAEATGTAVETVA